MVSKGVSDPFYLFLRGWLEQSERGQDFMKFVKNNPRDYAQELASDKKHTKENPDDSLGAGREDPGDPAECVPGY